MGNQMGNQSCDMKKDGELEGYYCDSNGIGCSVITEKNDDTANDFHRFHSDYDTLSNDNSMNMRDQIAAMEKTDNYNNSKSGSFDSDLERLQRERGEMMSRR